MKARVRLSRMAHRSISRHLYRRTAVDSRARRLQTVAAPDRGLTNRNMWMANANHEFGGGGNAAAAVPRAAQKAWRSRRRPRARCAATAETLDSEARMFGARLEWLPEDS